MKTPKQSPRWRAYGDVGEKQKGFSLIEILVALAIIAVIILITATQLGNRAVGARNEAVAGAITRTIRDESTIRASIGGGNWTRDIAVTRLQAALAGIQGVAQSSGSGTVAADATACDGSETDDIGVKITLTAGLTVAQVDEFEGLVHAQLQRIPRAEYLALWSGTPTIADPAIDADGSTTATEAFICLGNT